MENLAEAIELHEDDDHSNDNRMSLIEEINKLQSKLLTKEQEYFNVLNTQSPTFNHPYLQNISREITELKKQLFEKQSELNSLLSGSYSDFTKNEHKIKDVVKSAVTSATKADSISSEAINKANHALETATNAAGISAAKPLVQHFQELKTKFSFSTLIWITVTIFFFIFSIKFLEYIYSQPLPKTGSEAALFISNKIIGIVLFGAAISWGAKFFKDSYDKVSFYNHKIAITKTYQVFMESTLSQEIKDAVLKESMKHIFSAPPTSNNDSGKTEIEIIRNVASTMQKLTKA